MTSLVSLARFGVLVLVATGASTLCPALAPEAAASTLVHLDLETLSARADHIIVGTVERVDSHYLSPKSRYIVTDVTLGIEQRFLGDSPSNRFTVRRLGGEVGKVGQIVHGEAHYRVGDRVLLFAAQRQGVFYAVGMAQGAMPIYVDDEGAHRVRGPVADGLKLDDVLDKVREHVQRRETR